MPNEAAPRRRAAAEAAPGPSSRAPVTMRYLCRRDELRGVPVLRPVTEHAADAFKRLTRGEDFYVTIVQARRLRTHRAFFAMLRTVHETLPEDLMLAFPTETALRLWLIKTAGHVDEDAGVPDLETGEIVYPPKSIAFERMHEDEFREVFRDCIQTVRHTLCPYVDDAELRAEIEARVLEFA